MQNFSRKALFILIPFFFSVLLHILFRPIITYKPLVFLFGKSGLLYSSKIPRFVFQHLPSGFFAISSFFLINFFLRDFFKVGLLFSLAFTAVLLFLIEFFQYPAIHLINGYFDVYDLVAYFLGALLGFIYFSKFGFTDKE